MGLDHLPVGLGATGDVHHTGPLGGSHPGCDLGREHLPVALHRRADLLPHRARKIPRERIVFGGREAGRPGTCRLEERPLVIRAGEELVQLGERAPHLLPRAVQQDPLVAGRKAERGAHVVRRAAVHVAQRDHLALAGREGGDRAAQPGPQLVAGLRDDLAKTLADLAKTISAVPVTQHLIQGAAHREIARLAAASASDLIVMGTHGRTGIKRFFLGSVAERVVRTAACPVLVVPRAATR